VLVRDLLVRRSSTGLFLGRGKARPATLSGSGRTSAWRVCVSAMTQMG